MLPGCWQQLPEKRCLMTQVLQDIRGTQDVDEEFSDICDACVEANKVKHGPCDSTSYGRSLDMQSTLCKNHKQNMC